MKLQSIHIKRFKNIADASFDVSAVNVLIGANNSGKSTILQALHFSIGLLQTLNLEGKLIGKDLSVSLSPTQLIYSPCDNVYSLGPNGNLKEPKESAINIDFVLDNGKCLKISISKGRNRNIVIGINDATIAKTLSKIEKPFTIFTPGLAGVAKQENYVSDGVLLRTIARGDANIVLRNTLYRLWKTKDTHSDGRWNDFENDLHELFPNTAFTVDFNPSVDEFIRIAIDSGNGFVPLEIAGTGLLQAIQILSYIHYFNPSVLVLDEPDSHLHPNNQRLLCKLLTLVAQDRHIQILLSTHSRHVVDALKNLAELFWIRKGIVDKADDGDDLPILLDIGALDVKELITQNKTKCIVLTEDELKQNLELLLQSSGFEMDNTVVLPYYGCTSPHNLRALMHVIKGTNPKATVIIHRDRDYLTEIEQAEWAENIRALKAEPFLTPGTDVESVFLNEDHLATLNPKTKKEEFKKLISKAMKEVREENIKLYINSRIEIAKKTGTFGKLDIGALGVEAPHLYQKNPYGLRHGKTVLRKLRSIFQAENKTNLIISKATTFIKLFELQEIAKKIFKLK
ncbi:MAG: AAA family ATPase [Candidatus Omnitrophota bacterium]